MTKKVKKLWQAFLALDLVALASTVYLTYLHFKPIENAICDINEVYSCDIVNKSMYSELLGIPVALLGMGTYLLFFVIGLLIYKGKLKDPLWTTLLLVLAILGSIFSLYLSYIEFFVLFAVCIFCLTQQLVILTQSLILVRLRK